MASATGTNNVPLGDRQSKRSRIGEQVSAHLENLVVVGRSVYIYDDPHSALALETNSHLRAWTGNGSLPGSAPPLLIDVFDVRNHLDWHELCDAASGRRVLSLEPLLSAQELHDIEEERYRDQCAEGVQSQSDDATIGGDEGDFLASREVSTAATVDAPPLPLGNLVYQVMPLTPNLVLPKTAPQYALVAATARRVAAVPQLEVMLRVRQTRYDPLGFVHIDHPLHEFYSHLKARAALPYADWPDPADVMDDPIPPPLPTEPPPLAEWSPPTSTQLTGDQECVTSVGHIHDAAADADSTAAVVDVCAPSGGGTSRGAPAARRRPPTLLGVDYDSDPHGDSDEIEVDDEDVPDVLHNPPQQKTVDPAAVMPPALAAPKVNVQLSGAPPPAVAVVIDKLAEYVRRYGFRFAETVAAREAANPKFAFLHAWSPHHAHYLRAVAIAAAARDAVQKPAEQQNSSIAPEAVTAASVPAASIFVSGGATRHADDVTGTAIDISDTGVDRTSAKPSEAACPVAPGALRSLAAALSSQLVRAGIVSTSVSARTACAISGVQSVETTMAHATTQDNLEVALSPASLSVTCAKPCAESATPGEILNEVYVNVGSAQQESCICVNVGSAQHSTAGERSSTVFREAAVQVPKVAVGHTVAAGAAISRKRGRSTRETTASEDSVTFISSFDVIDIAPDRNPTLRSCTPGELRTTQHGTGRLSEANCADSDDEIDSEAGMVRSE